MKANFEVLFFLTFFLTLKKIFIETKKTDGAKNKISWNIDASTTN